MSALYKELFPEAFNTERKFHRQSSPLEENVFTHKPNAELGGREELTFHTVGCQTEENVAFSVASEASHDSLAFPVASEASGDTEQTFHRRQRLLKKHLIGSILTAATERVEEPWQTVETETERNGPFSVAPGNEGQYRKDKEHLEKGFGTYIAKAATIRPCHVLQTRVAGGEAFPAEAEEAEAERFRRGCGTLQQHFVKTRKAEMPIVTTQAVVRLILI